MRNAASSKKWRRSIMSFHRRWVMTDTMIENYQTHGIDSIKNIFTADAYVSDDSLAGKVVELVLNSKRDTKLWICVSEMVEKYIKESKKIN